MLQEDFEYRYRPRVFTNRPLVLQRLSIDISSTRKSKESAFYRREKKQKKKERKMERRKK